MLKLSDESTAAQLLPRVVRMGRERSAGVYVCTHVCTHVHVCMKVCGAANLKLQPLTDTAIAQALGPKAPMPDEGGVERSGEKP